MFKSISYQGNVNYNHNELSHTLIKMDKEKKNTDNTKHWQENRETKPLIYLQVWMQNGIVMWKIVW